MKILIALIMLPLLATAQINPLENRQGASVPAYKIMAVTPDNALIFTTQPRALYVGGAGDVRVVTWGGDTVTITGVPAGTLLPISVKQVLSTSTTATYIQVWW